MSDRNEKGCAECIAILMGAGADGSKADFHGREPWRFFSLPPSLSSPFVIPVVLPFIPASFLLPSIHPSYPLTFLEGGLRARVGRAGKEERRTKKCN
jgi:hypothetical protein